MLDVVVVGGGPAGLVAAEGLATRGARVAVLEEHDVIGTPVHCTGVLAAEAIRSLRLTQRAVLNPLSTVHFVAPGGRTLAYTTSSTEAIVIDRRVLDQSLADAATRAGVQVHCSVRVVNVAWTRDDVVLHAASGATWRARAVILACGAHYSSQQQLGLGLPQAFLQSAQMELPVTRCGDVEVHFGADIAPQGFAWVVPVQRPEGLFARIGVMAADHAATMFERMYARVRREWGVQREPGSVPRRRLLPLAPIGSTYADRTLVVGDAAGLVKPTTGGGIYYSILSSQLAADVLSDCLHTNDLRASALAAYERRWRERFEREFSAQLALRRLADRLNDRELDALFAVAGSDGLLPMVRRTARFNEHRALIVALLKYAPARHILMRRCAAAVL